MIYLISRHSGTLEWLKQQTDQPFTHLRHLDRADAIVPGDIVLGTLPVNLVADLCQRGVRYFHLEINLPEQLRGQELSAADLHKLGASLVEYVVLRPDKPGLK